MYTSVYTLKVFNFDCVDTPVVSTEGANKRLNLWHFYGTFLISSTKLSQIQNECFISLSLLMSLENFKLRNNIVLAKFTLRCEMKLIFRFISRLSVHLALRFI